MGLGEFGRIEKYFKPLAAGFPGALGLNDDAAILTVSDLTRLVVSNDAVVAGVHFKTDDPPNLVARKALRANLSDMAAMGAEPWVYTLTLALGAGDAEASDAWVAGLADGLASDQEHFGIHLIGGDSVTTPGPTMLSITIFGRQTGEGVLRRDGAQVGDDIYVSGTIGDAALGLKLLNGDIDGNDQDMAALLIDRYHLPRPRVALGVALLGSAHAAMDVSDGLVQDLSHICAASYRAGVIFRANVPLSIPARRLLDDGQVSDDDILGGGDDYELLFTAPASARDEIVRRAVAAGTLVTRIGKIGEGEGVTVHDSDGRLVPLRKLGYRHS
jgi:thiamine-monophosphate kinase